MSSAKVQINELRIRASDLSRDEAQRLGDAVAKRLVNLSVAKNGQRNIPSLRVGVQSSGTNSLEGIADAIGSSIRRSLE